MSDVDYSVSLGFRNRAQSPIEAAERAVIEAAEARHNLLHRDPWEADDIPKRFREADDALDAAVEALQEARDE